jgi:nucleoside 2-deoxyribosyltransferase
VKMRLVYIAGKYRGPNSWAIEQNIRAAEDLAAKVWSHGMAALCPHANSRHMDGVTSDEVFLAGTLELMRRCDAVLLVHNWRDSAGSLAEVDEAKRIGIPVFGLAQNGTPDDGALAGLCRWAAEGSA